MFLIHHKDTFKAAPHFVEQVKVNDKITIVRNASLDAILGDKMVEKVRVKHVDGRLEELPCAGVFAYIGLEPSSEFLPESVSRDDQGFVRTNESLETSLPGVYAIGAVRSNFGGTLDHAMDEARRVTEVVRGRAS